ncbi:MAG TPA: GNAT family N-acetyltransferase [Roseiflexaceae bacterium]|jgi:mycothiol synthase|nr:GNAT family N-acetyltransferase [Roseiflexaceae bacterium]
MSTVTNLVPRPYAGEADLQPICDLVNACDAVDQFDDNYAVDDLRLEFSDPRLDPAQDLRVWENEDGQVIGFGQLWIDRAGEKADGYLYFKVLPAARNNGVEDDIMEWGTERMHAVAAECGKPAILSSSAREEDSARRALLERYGLVANRFFFRMQRPLDQPIPEPQFPTGFTLTHTNGLSDAERWVAAYNQSFIDHWNFHPSTVERHQHWLTDPKYCTDLDLVAVTEDDTVAAFCFCFIDPDSNERNNRREGSINLLGVRRGFRKLGLGRAMLLAGMRALKDAGMDVVKLGVDAENPSGALRLYENVGFEVVYTNVAYAKDI